MEVGWATREWWRVRVKGRVVDCIWWGGGRGSLLFSMKVLSYNVRGLGGGEKRVEVRKLVSESIPM